MTLEEFKAKRAERLNSLHEKLSNMPDNIDDKVHGEIDVTELDAIKVSDDIDAARKERFKDKNKEVRQFIKDQDKAVGAAEEDKAEKRLILDESLFETNVKRYSTKR